MANQPEATQLAQSMKGYELYSWQENDRWVFSLLIGTNREKTLDEIKSPDTTLPDVEALISILEKVPSGQYVSPGRPGRHYLFHPITSSSRSRKFVRTTD